MLPRLAVIALLAMSVVIRTQQQQLIATFPACFACADYQDAADDVPGCGCPLGAKWFKKNCKRVCKNDPKFASCCKNGNGGGGGGAGGGGAGSSSSSSSSSGSGSK